MSRTFLNFGVLRVRPVNGADRRGRKDHHVVGCPLRFTRSALSKLPYLLDRDLEVCVPLSYIIFKNKVGDSECPTSIHPHHLDVLAFWLDDAHSFPHPRKSFMRFFLLR